MVKKRVTANKSILLKQTGVSTLLVIIAIASAMSALVLATLSESKTKGSAYQVNDRVSAKVIRNRIESYFTSSEFRQNMFNGNSTAFSCLGINSGESCTSDEKSLIAFSPSGVKLSGQVEQQSNTNNDGNSDASNNSNLGAQPNEQAQGYYQNNPLANNANPIFYGFRSNGSSCTTNESTCNYKMNFSWKPWCESGEATCANPKIQLLGRIEASQPESKKTQINFKKFEFSGVLN